MILQTIGLAAALFAAPASQTPMVAAPPGPEAARAVATAVRATATPVIDGSAADAAWQNAARFSDFRQFEPQPNGDPSFRTEFQVAYDERNLYVFLRAYDPHPDSICARSRAATCAAPPISSRSSSTRTTTGVPASSSLSIRTG